MDRSHQKNPGQGLGISSGEGQGKVSDARTTYYDDCIADLDSSGEVVRSYTYGPGIDNPLAMTTYSSGTNTYYYLTDHLGSVLALIDEDGQLVESYEYDAFGRIRVFDSAFEEISESAYGNRITFQGREYSWATGLYYFRARWYEPVTGRWLSKDPIGISGGLNQYVGFGGNGVNFIDPFGLEDGIFVSLVNKIFNWAEGTLGTLDEWDHLNRQAEEEYARSYQKWREENPNWGSCNDALLPKVDAALLVMTFGRRPSMGRPLLGRNPRFGGGRVNTGLPGGRPTAKSIFRNQTRGQEIVDVPMRNGGIRRVAPDGTQIRFNADGSTRLDLTGRGPTGRETIHFE